MIRVRINWTGLNEGFSLLHFANDLADAQTTASAVTNFLNGVDTYVHTTQLMRVDPEVEQINVATGQVEGVATVTSAQVAGLASGTPVPQLAQALIRWRTGQFVSGRELRGRTFIPGITSTHVSAAGEPTSALISGLAGEATNFIGSTDVGVWSPTHSVFFEAVSATVWTEFASMKSRRD